ncbi:hypothetical protein V8G54_033473 [Vigna mungo]|uniref:Heparan-alpha-glucosaminide N-acetyltransferase catalytic domain-containing protein n=1 Tax=Vigna mungo TaxID=3915 RepID=A0AAQ3MNZ8_VIGMU
MAEMKGEQHSLNVSEVLPVSDTKLPKPKRVASLDIFRGLTVALMILVDDAGGKWPMIGHAPWNGCNLADFVMPFFLFIVGMAIPLALKRIPNRLVAVKKVLVRTLKLLFWGLLLQGGFSHAPDNLTYGVDMKQIRWCGILQRIALAYLVVALVEIFSRSAQDRDPPTQISILKLYYWHWLVGACILAVYLALLYGMYVPDWQFTVHNPDSIYNGTTLTVTCGVRGKLDPPCNVVGYIDREVLGINHMYKRPAWRRSELNICYSLHNYWIAFWTCTRTLTAIPLNKQLYTLSYVCVTSGAAALVFSAFYIVFRCASVINVPHFSSETDLELQVDIWGLTLLFLPLKWIGMNAMLVYVMAAEGIFAGFINGWYYDDPHNTLTYWIQKHVFINVWHSKRVGILLYVIFAEILFWALVAGILHRLGIYWKL